MRCIGSTCNSNGAWFSKFSMGLTSATCKDAPLPSPHQSVGRDNLCQGTIELVRTWAPFGGGGKPFNPHMGFNATVHLKVLTAPDLVFEEASVASEISNHDSSPATGSGTFDMSANSSNFVVGVTSFSWELASSSREQGRYFEHVGFSVAKASNASYTYRAGVLSPPLTTLPSKVTVGMGLVGITSKGFNSGPEVQETVTVCEDDKATKFSCVEHNMTAQLCAQKDIVLSP